MTLVDSLTSITESISSITFRPNTDLVYAEYFQPGGGGQHEGGFMVIDASECAVVNTLELGLGVSEPVFSSSGSDLYVLWGNSILRLDPDTGTEFASRNFDEQLAALTIDPSNNMLYVSCMKNDAFAGGVLAVEGSNLTIQDSLEYGEALGQLCHVPSLEYLYVNLLDSDSQQLLIIDEFSMEVLGTVQLSKYLEDMLPDHAFDIFQMLRTLKQPTKTGLINVPIYPGRDRRV